MSGLSRYIRRSFAGAAAALSMSAALSGAAQAQAPAFPEHCNAFNDATPVRKNSYDDAMRNTIRHLKDYSRWNDLQAALQRSSAGIQGLCPAPMNPANGFIAVDLATRSFDLNIVFPTGNPEHDNFGKIMLPDMVLEKINDGSLSYAGPLIRQAATIAADRPGDSFVRWDDDFDTGTLLYTVAIANGFAEEIFFAVEAAAEDKRDTDLDNLYNLMPALVADINDIHAKALAAKDRNRTLSDDERKEFRDSLVAYMLKDPASRQQAAHQIGQGIQMTTIRKMSADAQAGRAITPPVFRPYSSQEITERLKRLPGHLDSHDAIRNYKAYWEANKASDPAQPIQEALKILPARTREHIDQVMRELGKAPAPRPS